MAPRRFAARFKGAARRLADLSSLAGGPIGALGVMVSGKLNPSALQTVHYHGRAVRFRGTDEQALKEVLVDGEYSFLSARLRGIESPKVLDIGAHIGTFALWVTHVCPKASITAVEADPATFRLVERNFVGQEINGTVINRAAAANDGQQMRFSDSGPSMSHRVDADGAVIVQSISLRSLVQIAAGVRQRIDLAKIDVEGSEEALICENPDAVARIDALVIELHPGLCDTDRVRSALASHFSKISEIAGRRSTKPLLYCERDV